MGEGEGAEKASQDTPRARTVVDEKKWEAWLKSPTYDSGTRVVADTTFLHFPANALASGKLRFLRCHFPNGLELGDRGDKTEFIECEFETISAKGRSLRKIRLDRCVIRSKANFLGTKFDDHAYFDGTEFRGPADFAAAWDRKSFVKVSFAGAKFHKEPVSFASRTFLASANFKGAVFHVAPRFHGCTFFPDTDFRGVQFHDVSSPDAYKAYRTLAALAAQIGDRKLEFHAHRLEQQSLRNAKIVGRFERMLSWLYDKFYACGTSMARPVAIQFALWVLGGLALHQWVNGWQWPILGLAVTGDWWSPLDWRWNGNPTIKDTASFVAQQSFRPFSVWGRFEEWIRGNIAWKEHLWPFGFIGTATSLFTFLNVFMFGLAARRIFKMGSTSA